MPNAKEAGNTAPHRFLLLGDTGSGKTTQVLTLPGKKFLYLFDSNALLSLRGQDVDYEEFLPDKLNLNVKSLKKETGGDSLTMHKSDLYLQWQKDFEDKLRDGFFEPYDVVGMDSFTTFLDLVMDRILTINGRYGQWPQQDDYGPQMMAFTNVCRTLVGMGKTIYCTGHLEYKQDELSKRIYRQPMMTGRLRSKIPLLFSDIFVAEAESDTKGNTVYKIQTTKTRLDTAVRTSIRGLEAFEDVTIDWKKPLENQGLGRLLQLEKEGKLK